MTVGIPTLPSPERPSNRPRRGWIALLLVCIVVLGAAAAWWQLQPATDDTGTSSSAPVPRAAALDDTTARAPQGTRVRVRIVNTSGVTGLARRATQHLRDYGFDVVDFTSGRADADAPTRITVHTGHQEWGTRAQKALGVGTVGTDADTSRYVDLTVFLGRDWRPSPQALRP